MSTAQEVCTRALRRMQAIDSLHSASAEEARDALAALNEMLYNWKALGVDLLLQAEFAASDTFVFWVPPVSLASDVIDGLSYRGVWNASTNSPSLATGTGTEGYVYKVDVAGSTTLDDVSSWSVNDFAVFDGTDWLKGESSEILKAPVIAMLARRLCDDFSMPVPAGVASDAVTGWHTVQSYYVKPPVASFEQGLRAVPSRTLTVAWEDN
jgi:hypothetical protein